MKDPSQYKNKVIINQQAYYTDSIKINQVNSNVIIQNQRGGNTAQQPLPQAKVNAQDAFVRSIQNVNGAQGIVTASRAVTSLGM
jgi:hypothetical protein